MCKSHKTILLGVRFDSGLQLLQFRCEACRRTFQIAKKDQSHPSFMKSLLS